jgi:chemotaxis protein MotB
MAAAKPGAPAWMATFADLMSLLLAFFVLLFSFSELDNQKYKEVAGSMRDAFGVQLSVKVKDPPKGINIIAREFSPGMTAPTPLNQVRQFTTKDAMRNPAVLGSSDASKRNRAEEKRKKLDQKKIQVALQDEISKGLIEIEITDQKIIVRIREKGSFLSGSKTLEKSFVPVVARLAETLKDTKGQILISGHTDSVPISNSQFQSNWELSAARAASVAHVILADEYVPSSRVRLEAYADTQPIDTNESEEGRAKNRRVEIAVVYGKDTVAESGGHEGRQAKSNEQPSQEGVEQ